MDPVLDLYGIQQDTIDWIAREMGEMTPYPANTPALARCLRPQLQEALVAMHKVLHFIFLAKSAYFQKPQGPRGAMPEPTGTPLEVYFLVEAYHRALHDIAPEYPVVYPRSFAAKARAIWERLYPAERDWIYTGGRYVYEITDAVDDDTAAVQDARVHELAMGIYRGRAPDNGLAVLAPLDSTVVRDNIAAHVRSRWPPPLRHS